MRHLCMVLCACAVLLPAGCGDDDEKSVNPTEDREGPVVTITHPAEDESLAPGMVIIRARATDNHRVRVVTFFDDEEPIGEDRMGVLGMYDIRWTAGGGEHVLKALAVDLAGNTGQDTCCVTCSMK